MQTDIPPDDLGVGGEQQRKNIDQRSVGALVSDVITGVTTLVRQELRLAQAEGTEKLSQAAMGAIAILAGLLVASCALLILLQALVIALAEYTTLSASLSALIVGVVVALIAFVLIARGQRNLSLDRLTPERTIRTLRDDKEMVMEKAR
jgi:uncharacterized membrane protein YqjE